MCNSHSNIIAFCYKAHAIVIHSAQDEQKDRQLVVESHALIAILALQQQ